ncbi:MAG: membrane dipeptidase [Phycisphaerales bacterium]|nr:membrane dipeptidase [Phycisphaerales bacterium]
MTLFFDAHLDLAYLAVSGRDMLRPLAGLQGPACGPHPPASVTLPELSAAGVRLALGTIFTEPVADGRAEPAPEQYPAGDAEAAHRRGRAQLEAYLTWRDQGLVALDLRAFLRGDPHVGQIRGGMGVAEAVPEPVPERLARERSGRIHLGILIENADPIRGPEDLAWWKERGVVAVGLAWARSSRYAAGNGADDGDRAGLTDAGRRLMVEMDRLGVVLDLSHLSRRATEEALAATDRPVIASHSNCRQLLGGEPAAGAPRHLADATIREIARRGGVIGVNLYAKFLLAPGEAGPATTEHVWAHIDHICHLAGGTRSVGLGSDADGGFSADLLPSGIRRARDFTRLAEMLAAKNWPDEDIAAFCWGNWARFWGAAPP